MAKKRQIFSVGDILKIVKNTSYHNFKTNEMVKVIDVNLTNNCVLVSSPNKSTQWIYDVDAVLHTKAMSVKAKTLSLKQMVEDAANSLLRTTSSTSTLEVRKVLEKQYPNRKFYQNEISVAFQELAKEGKYDWTYNGVYRVYVNKPKSVQSVKSKSKSLSKTKALELIENSNRIITAVFTKKDGVERKVTGRYFKQNSSKLGYVCLKDVNKAKTNANPVVNVNIQTLSELKVNGVLYKVG